MTGLTRLAAAIVLAASLLLAGCGGPAAAPVGAPAGEPAMPSSGTQSSLPSNPQRTPASTAPTPTRALPSTSASALPSTAPVRVPDTLRFEATTVDGARFDPATLAGKPVLFWFWAPWCPTCKAQIPQVQKLAKQYEGKVAIVGVGSLDGGDAIKRFADDAWGMTHLTDEQGKIWKHFGVAEQSSFVLLDAAGAKAYSVGYGGSDKLGDEVARVAG